MESKKRFRIQLDITFDNSMENSRQNKETLIRNILNGLRNQVVYAGLYPEDAGTDGDTKEVSATLDEVEGVLDFNTFEPHVFIFIKEQDNEK